MRVRIGDARRVPRAAGVVAAICLTLLAALAVSLLAAPAARAQSGALPKLGIKTSRDAIVWDRRGTRITGMLRTPPGVSSAGRLVKLYERPYPYRRSKVVARTRTNDRGRYSFGAIEPDYNSRYRAAVSEPGVEARSDSPLVVVYAQGDFVVRATRGGTAEVELELRYSPKLPTDLDGLKTLFYFNKVGARKARVKDTSRTKVRRRGILRAQGSFGLPPGRYRFEVRYCIRTSQKRDIGLGPPVEDRRCPRSFRVRRTQAMSTGATAVPPGDVAVTRRR